MNKRHAIVLYYARARVNARARGRPAVGQVQWRAHPFTCIIIYYIPYYTYVG